MISLLLLRTFGVSPLADLRRLLSKPASIYGARSLPAEQFGKLTLPPVSESGNWNHKAVGSVDLSWESVVRVDGAGGVDST
jgi:hypothetical protein